MTKQNPIPKVLALILISLGLAWLLMASDTSALAKLNSMSASDYIQYQRDLHQHSFVVHYLLMLIMGGFFLGAVEFLAYVIGLAFPKKTEA